MFKLLGAAALLLSNAYAQNASASLPTVDLGYEIHQASFYNSTGRFYNFSNIRYAAPPIGNLRFAVPQSPATNRSAVQTGTQGKICPQAAPAWNPLAAIFLTDLILGQPDPYAGPYVPPGSNASSYVPPQDPRTTEDCLFLDLVVPEGVFNNAGKGNGSAVLVWIYGGGYTAGEKSSYAPAGLLAASGNVTNGDVIYISINYRLGALGWLSGPSYEAEGGVPNLGLYDQRFALEWIQNNIHLFGGDPNRVTVFGESAGGGSIMHQITAYGGDKGPVPFQQAVPQSPGFLPVSSNSQQEDTYQRFLNISGAKSLAGLRNLTSAQVIRSSYLQVAYDSPYGGYTYGPVVDGEFVPLQTGQLLAQGRFDKSLKVMVGHNANEGTYFTPPYINSTAAMLASAKSTFPDAPASWYNAAVNVYYPDVLDGTHGYTTEFGRGSLFVSEGVFTCNTFFLDKAFGNQTYSYLFSLPPAFHGFDLPYTYYDGGALGTSPLTVTNRTVALALQDFITSFALTGVPSAPGIRKFDMYGPNAQVLDLDITGITEVQDTNANERCNWWQKALYS